MPQMSKVELYAAIRRDHRDGMSMRELERKHGVTWRTVRKALDSAWPEPPKKLPPRATALDPYKPVIDEILRADLDAPRKQRPTVTRVFHRPVEEHEAEVSYGIVRYYVAARKPEILAESGRAPREAFVPQTHQPGHEAAVDFGDVTVRLAGELVTCYLFSFRLSYSGKAVHRVIASCGQEAFFEGHIHALRTLGGVPRSKVRYDNLKAAVARVLGLSRARVEADRWIAFKSHFGIESCYCRPGIEGAHESRCCGASLAVAPSTPATPRSKNSAARYARSSPATTSPAPACAARSTVGSRSWRTGTARTQCSTTARTAP